METLQIVLAVLGLYILLTSLVYGYRFLTTHDLVKKSYKKRLITNAVIIGVFVLIYLFLNMGINTLGTARDRGAYSSTPNTLSMPCPPGLCGGYDNSYTNDLREFMKVYFSANIDTRYVKSVARKTELLIKGSGGRIDSSNVSEKYSYFQFVIPKSELDDFQDELETYAHPKLYSESTRSENLLNQKQNLEREQDVNQTNIQNLNTQKAKLQADYKARKSSLDKQIRNLEAEYALLPQDTSDDTRQSYATKIQALKNQLAQETANFKREMSNLGVSLAEQNTILGSLNQQEDDFFDNIETVNGSVSINYINLWNLFTKLSPIHPIILIAIILVIMRTVMMIRKDRRLVSQPQIVQ